MARQNQGRQRVCAAPARFCAGDCLFFKPMMVDPD
jgi:hypothetical protein